jgi:hypothetical protein
MDKMEEKELNGIGGWLTFFIITIMIISPIISLTFLFTDVPLTIYDYIEGFGTISVLILSGIFLLQKKSYAVLFTKLVLVGMFITTIIYLFLGEFETFMNPIYPIIWFWYFSVSKRVKITYGKLKEPEKGNFVWPKLSIIYAFIAPMFGLIFSIISLNKISKHRNLKGLWLSVGALIISILVFVAFLFVGAVSTYAPESIDIECNNICYDNPEATQYIALPTANIDAYNCVCMDDAGEEVYSQELRS